MTDITVAGLGDMGKALALTLLKIAVVFPVIEEEMCVWWRLESCFDSPALRFAGVVLPRPIGFIQ